jgi:hypothetical protein
VKAPLKPRAGAARPSPEEVLRVAADTAPRLPPAQVTAEDRLTTLNLRVRTSTVAALAAAAQERGLTMKLLVARGWRRLEFQSPQPTSRTAPQAEDVGA